MGMNTIRVPNLPHPALTEVPREIAQNCEAIWFGAPHGKTWKLIEEYFVYRMHKGVMPEEPAKVEA